MINENLLDLIKEFRKKVTDMNQTLIYPSINNEVMEMVKRDFPSFDSKQELPLITYHDGDNSVYANRYFVITNTRLYYRIGYLPYRFEVLDCIDIRKIKNIDIKLGWLDSYIQINNKKIGSIQLNSKEEAKYIKELVNIIIINLQESYEIQGDFSDSIIDYPIVKNMDNYRLFSIAKEYFAEINLGGRLWGFDWFFYGPFIPKEKLELAIKEYAAFDPNNEQPILFFDESFAGKILGFVVTNKYFYYRLKSKSYSNPINGKVLLADMTGFEFKYLIWGKVIINNRNKFITNFLTKRDGKVVEELMNKFINELSRGSMATQI